ncbi:hypothetical protein SAMN03159382_02181 [Pseudomonas sp. NFACC23-1]|uniref:hypothetical protein n=1 Tax=unclassified Pseudomonas TaxID=196821 RepID=UPI00088364BC|nr:MULTISPECIES: hypothetical protein [unclassified Pseudomonas]SDB27018.1 hypothetical protein SAMN03159386_01955 [Pseudomonas sp. NFACC17-2]SEJ36834.1 hypothetical protein SAMN03159382_02181 [Pseudomonas sp. NFACC23-1]SFW55744.1 hypothetical protein SAMN05660640_02000 [Pseudomonas sp. NFACC16-2]
MASLNKQQKRAKRAKDKAKQIRMSGRKSIPMYGDPAHATAQPPVYVLELFAKLREAEAISRSEMLDTLLASLSVMISERPLLDLKNAENESMAATNLAADMLVDYRMWVDDMDRETAQRWLSTPEFIQDFSEALDRYRQSMEEPASE